MYFIHRVISLACMLRIPWGFLVRVSPWKPWKTSLSWVGFRDGQRHVGTSPLGDESCTTSWSLVTSLAVAVAAVNKTEKNPQPGKKRKAPRSGSVVVLNSPYPPIPAITTLDIHGR